MPRHRGIAAVEWTILEGDPIAGGSVYHLADGWDVGAIAAQDWCFVGKGETARELWERAPRPDGARPADARRSARGGARRTSRASAGRALRDEGADDPPDDFAVEEGRAVGTSLIVTAIGTDRPGIVSLLSDRAQGFGANWAGSRMANLAGQFAGMVHFEVPAQNAEPLAQALRGLEASGLRVVIEKVETSAPAGRRMVKLELTGLDRPGIVRDLSRNLAQQAVSIDDLHTEIVDGGTSAEHLFKVKALLVVPDSLPNEKLRQALDALANEMMVDIALGEHAAA